MKTNKFTVFFFVFSLLSLPGHAADSVSLTAAQIDALGIKTAPVSRASHASTHGLPARVVLPNNQLFIVSSPLSGYIEKMEANANDHVKKGQVLAWLQSPSLAEAERAYLEAQTRFQLASETMERDKKLFDEGIISRGRYSSSRSRYIEAQAAASGQKQILMLSGLSGAELKALAENGKIGSTLVLRSPLDGFVLEQLGIAGQRVDASSPIYRIAQLSPIWLEIEVPASLLPRLKEDSMVTVQGTDAEGVLYSIGKSVNPASQTVMVRAKMTRNIDLLKPGLKVEAKISSASENLWQISSESLARIGGNPAVFVRTPSGFSMKPVEVVSESGTEILVKGLSGDETIAVHGIAALKSALSGSK
jgi:RND family efflux transporter MFP subunit